MQIDDIIYIPPTIEDIKKLLSRAETKLSELRDEKDNETLSEAHRKVSEAITSLDSSEVGY